MATMTEQLGLFPDSAVSHPPAGLRPAEPPQTVRRTASGLPESVRLGTSSWSFPGWAGLVYDRRASASVLAREGLAAYAAHPLFRTVGVDRTFYRPMDAAAFAEYAEAVPDDFRFVVKADRLLTFPTDPGAYGVRAPNRRFLDAEYAVREVVEPMLKGLGAKAGVLLFQFPPMHPNQVGGRKAFLDGLRAFLARLPEGPTYAVELRTPALLTDAYADVLDATGTAHCYTVHPAMSSLAKQLETVLPFYQPALVVRWMLHAGFRYDAAKERYAPFDRIVDEDVETRQRIATMTLDVTVAERQAFIIANNKAEGSAPLTVARLAERLVEWDGTAPHPHARKGSSHHEESALDESAMDEEPLGRDRHAAGRGVRGKHG